MSTINVALDEDFILCFRAVYSTSISFSTCYILFSNYFIDWSWSYIFLSSQIVLFLILILLLLIFYHFLIIYFLLVCLYFFFSLDNNPSLPSTEVLLKLSYIFTYLASVVSPSLPYSVSPAIKFSRLYMLLSLFTSLPFYLLYLLILFLFFILHKFQLNRIHFL